MVPYKNAQYAHVAVLWFFSQQPEFAPFFAGVCSLQLMKARPAAAAGHQTSTRRAAHALPLTPESPNQPAAARSTPPRRAADADPAADANPAADPAAPPAAPPAT